MLTPPQLSTRVDDTLRHVYESGSVRGEGREIRIWPSGMTQEGGRLLSDLVRGCGAVRTLETGFATGLSTLWILRAALAADRADGSAAFDGTGVRHVAIDPFQARDWGNAGLRLAEQAGVRDRIEHIDDDSALALPALVRDGRRFDFILLDGGHLFENIFLDLHFAVRLCEPGGVIVVDDLWMPAIRAALAYFETNLGLKPEPLGDAPGAKRFAVLRMPETLPKRAWDHFVSFG